MSTATYNRLNKDDAVVLLVDHQTGLISLVQDFSPNEFKNNVLALADLAKFFNLPTILTTSFEQGPNGPLVPELKEMFPDAPYIARPGQINAWDNEDFVKAIKATGRKQIIIAVVATEVRRLADQTAVATYDIEQMVRLSSCSRSTGNPSGVL